MQIVTDSGTDVGLSVREREELGIHVVPLTVSLQGQSYREGLDIAASDFYRLLDETGGLPTTSQPSVGDFADLYRRLASDDPDILSIHMSAGLSGTLNSARAAAQLVPEANVVHVDTKTLSAGAGWQVTAAARAAQDGWSTPAVLDLIAGISAATDSMFTLQELKYLIHGGRISHMKGLIASVLNIKPVIGVEKVRGTYVQMGQARAFKGALTKLVGLVSRKYAPGSSLRVQVVHGQNPEGAQLLREAMDQVFDCTWLPTGAISLVLGAHTGPSLVGLVHAPAAAFDGLR
ncbi:MAG: DegV family protein [Anaerolineae bacterium]|jgi:DegV family protein with EDD domain